MTDHMLTDKMSHQSMQYMSTVYGPVRPSSYAELLPQRIKFRSSKKSKCELNSAQIRRLKPKRKTIFNFGTNSASLPHLNFNFVLNSGWFQTSC